MMKLTTKKSRDKMAKFIRDHADLFTFTKVGDVVEGTVIEKSPRALIVDLGKFGTGVAYRGELLNARDTIRNLEPGNKVQAKVVETDNDDGFVELSLSEAEKQKSWLEIEELRGKEEVFQISVTGANKGGLLAEVAGLKAFLPASQLTQEHYPDVDNNEKSKIEEELQNLIGKKLEVKIIDANPRNNKLIISERAAKEEGMKELAKNYEVGQIVEGVVSGIADFGVFVKFADNPDVEGLIHVSELSYKMVENPKEIVSVDDAIKIQIIDISKDGKISLSLKALEPDPWKQVSKKLTESQEIDGKVYSLNPFGATVDLGNGFQGQIHVTEFGSVENMEKELEAGKSYKFQIKEIKPDDKRIILELIK